MCIGLLSDEFPTVNTSLGIRRPMFWKAQVLRDVRNRSTIIVCEVKIGAKILPTYSLLDIKVKQQLQSGENASLYAIE